MAIETERFQVVVSEAEGPDGALAILVDSATGRSWFCRDFTAQAGATWQPLAFAADAPAAPGGGPKRKPARRGRSG